MIGIVRNWRLVVGGTAAGLASVVGLAGVSASADPQTPIQPLPAPATVTVTVTPDAATPNASAASQAVPAEQTPPAGPATIPATTAAAAPAASITPATSGTIAEFLKEKGVAMEPEKSQGFTALNIVLPMPPGWTVVPDPNVPDAFSVIADRQGGDGLYTSNAQLVVYKLVGEFDPREAISHGYVDSQQLFAWQTTDASMSEFGGFPSSVIEGTYRENDLTLNTSRRNVIVQSGANRYLVALSVTTSASQVVATADATDAIVNGFRVSVPGAIPAAAPAAAAPAAAAPPAAAMTAPAATAAAGALPAAANPAAVGAPATILVPAPQR
ncbi:MAG: LpqN/LpqT family lipoprotein [Mycobacterium sp.]